VTSAKLNWGYCLLYLLVSTAAQFSRSFSKSPDWGGLLLPFYKNLKNIRTEHKIVTFLIFSSFLQSPVYEIQWHVLYIVKRRFHYHLEFIITIIKNSVHSFWINPLAFWMRVPLKYIHFYVKVPKTAKNVFLVTWPSEKRPFFAGSSTKRGSQKFFS
jgi:hypothetical protein